MEPTPSLSDLTFDVEPRREWTPPNPESPLVPSDMVPPRTVGSTPSSILSRSSPHSKPSPRPSIDTHLHDMRRPHATPPPQPTLTHVLPPPQPQSPPSSTPASKPAPEHPPEPSVPGPASASSPTPAPGSSAGPCTAPSTAPSTAGDTGRSTRRTHLSPVRVVCPEPSFTQPSFSELPTIRGQPVTSLMASPRGLAGFGAAANFTGIGAGATLGAAPAAGGGGGGPGGRRSPVPPGASGTGLDAVNGSGFGAGFSGSGGIPLLPERRTPRSFHSGSSGQDPVDHYLARFQVHRVIRNQFRVRQDEHFRTVQELGARIQAMTRPESAGAGQGTVSGMAGGGGGGRGGGGGGGEKMATEPAGSAGAAAPSSAPSSPSATRGAIQVQWADEQPPSSPPRLGVPAPGEHPVLLLQPHPHLQPHPQQQQQQQQQLPDHPLQPRNRFAPPPAATLTSAASVASPSSGPSSLANSARHLPASSTSPSSSRCTSPDMAAAGRQRSSGGASTSILLRSGLTADGADPPGDGVDRGAVAAAAAAACGPHPAQGAYLALPDGSFAGSPPLRCVPKTEGLLFERYSRRSLSTGEDLPELQLRYLRPGIPVPKEPRPLRRVPRQPPPPARALPNGIPASRLERLSARRRDRSPPRSHQQQHLLSPQPQYQQELLRFTGAPVSTSRSTSPTATLTGAVVAAATSSLAAVGDGLLRSPALSYPPPYGRAASAPSGSDGAGGGSLAQYLAVNTSARSGEPLLDESFYSVLQQHFRTSLQAQTTGLRAQLNVNLPLVLGALNCVNVTEPPARPRSAMKQPPTAAAAAAADGAGAGGGGGGASVSWQQPLVRRG